jgi:hypothetical protein
LSIAPDLASLADSGKVVMETTAIPCPATHNQGLAYVLDKNGGLGKEAFYIQMRGRDIIVQYRFPRDVGDDGLWREILK